VGLKFNDKFKKHVLCKHTVSLNISFMATNAPLTYTNTVFIAATCFGVTPSSGKSTPTFETY